MKSVMRIGFVASSLLINACSVESVGSEEGNDDTIGDVESSLQGTDGMEAALSVTKAYFGGYCARVTVSNRGSAATSSWTTTMDMGGKRLTWSADGEFAAAGDAVTVKSTSSNAVIQAGGSTQYRFCASGSHRTPATLTAVSAIFESGAGSGGSSGGTGGAGGAGGTGGAGGAGGTGGAGGAGGNSGGSTGEQPRLPEITGACPTFTTGTKTVGGLSGISMQVGPKREGTGSLIFYWHGTGSSASEVNSMVPSAVRQEILDQGGIIVSFQGSLSTGGDCSGTSTFSKDDFKIADQIAACAVRDHGIDPRRIYTTGCSAGGLQAGCMGALRSSYVAAVVPNSGGLVSRQPIQDQGHVPAVMTMHGGSSDRVVVSFAQTSATYDEQMSNAGSFVVNCNHGGGHCRAPAALYTAAWEFMKAHPFGVEPEPYASGLPASFPSYCEEY
ncbi:cellulose binding domain-containing protein [Sorangium sp. So ce131]|uniref:cellulose binding domain-containing protein n=1 Tax=Sorangium sp. So ce131 TaxID=3133282 RepID=UPI003F61AA86